VDPNEPVYCYCNRVSFGEASPDDGLELSLMIACENEDCAREWFHLECVGLDKAPEGAWYCDDCVAE
ncbi:inhibitor of growth protein, partial [Rhodotorula sp. JG-1b]